MELTIVLPVYNETEIIGEVIKSWVNVLEKRKIDYEICAYNDGSTDNTLKILNNLEKSYNRLKVINKPNSGHGPTILIGYREAKGEWIFQVDSDNEMKSKYFDKLWSKKNDYDFLVGNRENRESTLSRRIITLVSRLTVKLIYGQGIHDVNSPYRLYRREKYKDIFNNIPINTFAPNIILSGISIYKKYRIYETPIPVEFRKTGEVSIKKMKLIKAAFKSFIQTIQFRYKECIT